MSPVERKSTRLESDQFISYRVYDAEDRVCDEGMAKATDISKSGVAVENRTPFEVGAKIELTIALSDDLVKANGIVRNVDQVDDLYQIGIEFENISDDQIQQLGKEFPAILE